MNVQFTENNPKVLAIFETTLQLVSENGFHGTAMSKIASEADVAIGTIYHYFPSKDDLIISLFQYCGDKINFAIDKAIDETLCYKDNFFRTWEGFVEFHIEHQNIFGFFEQFYSSPYYQISSCEKNEKITGKSNILTFLEKGIEIGELKNINVEALACVFFGSAVSAIKGMNYNRFKSKKSTDDVIHIIWDGVKNK